MDADKLLASFEALWSGMIAIDIGALPGVGVDHPGFGDVLPFSTAAVYFLVSGEGRLLYIGKAANLRNRWRVAYQLIGTGIDWSACHGKLKDAVALGGVVLRWWELPRRYLATAESILLQIHEPPWNCHRG